MKQWAIGAAVLGSILVVNPTKAGPTTSHRSVGQVVGYDGIRLVPQNIPTGLMSAFQQAYNSWNACTSGEAPQFGQIWGEGVGRQITVMLVSGFSDQNEQRCGQFSGNTIIIFEEVRRPDGTTTRCDLGDRFSEVVQHELGHAVGLRDSCQGIMNNVGFTSTGAYVHRIRTNAECTMVNQTNKTPTEQLEEQCASGNQSACQDLQECEPPDSPSCSPIVFDLGGRGFAFTSVEDGAVFDIDGDQVGEQSAWTERRGDLYFLALDRNGNGTIDGAEELFGDSTPMLNGERSHNGYQALFELDVELGNNNGFIDRNDAIYERLVLWRDRNHNGFSESAELFPLARVGIEAIRVEYAVNLRADHSGNVLRYFSWASQQKDGGLRRVATVDVYFQFKELR